MRSSIVHFFAATAVCATLFIETTYVSSAESENISSAKDLPAACRQAKAKFRPLTQADIEQAETVLTQALDRLDQKLAQAGDNGEAWRKYLKLAELRDQLRRNQVPDKGALKPFNSGHEGLELVWFIDVQKALQNYQSTSYAAKNPREFQAFFEDRLGTLGSSLERYVVKPTTEDARKINESLGSLDEARQVPELVQAIQRHFVLPNFMGEISPAVLGAGIAEPVDDTMPIRDYILGTDVTGTAHTVGKTNVELSPDPNFGVIDTLFSGTTTSENVGYHGPVTIYSNSTTSLAARKRLWVDASGLSSYPSASSAVTEVQICDIQSNKGRAMIERMAWKRAGKQQSDAECIASQHAEQRLNERIDQQAAEAIDRANNAYVDKFQRPFTQRKLFPQELRFSTTAKALSVVGLQAGGAKLAAPGSPPAVAEGAEMSLRLHESMVNNLAFDALAGRTVYEEKVQAAAVDALGHLPEKMKGDDDGKPWAITFAARQPISVTFADDGFKITIRGANFHKGQDTHPAMDISATYKIQPSAKGFKVVRQGDIQVLPPDFVQGKQIDAHRQIIRKLLEKRFAKVFEQEILGEGFELPGKWKAAGKLLPIQVVCRDGWLVVAWKRAPAEPQAAIAAR